MLVDDHVLVRRGVHFLLDEYPEWHVCAEASGGQEALALAAEERPDIVVLDVSMPLMSGIDVAVQLRKLLPKVEILMLTLHESEQFVGDALRAGVRGYLLKSETEEELILALRALSNHRPYFSGNISETLLKRYVDSAPSSDVGQLTPRERQIVKLVAEGMTNKHVARFLSVSVKTVETHRSSAMRKVGANSSADLTLYAARNGLVEL
jgi:DNA-binding NarL/FixJ family response regulator